MSLEQRLSGLTEDQLAAVAEGHGLMDTAKTQVISQGIKYSLEDGSVEEKDPTTDGTAEEDNTVVSKETSEEVTPTESVTSDTVSSTSSETMDSILGGY